MAKKFNFKSKSLWKKIGLGCLCGVVGLGAIMGVGALLNKEDETTKVINPTYAIGGLTEQGAYLDTKASIYTENAFECQGLDIDMDFKNNVSYRVFFYDEDNDFLSSTPKLSENYDETTTPMFAKYARIVITPNDDDEIKWHEKNGYANQLEIEVNKEQNATIIDELENCDNLAVYNSFGTGGFYQDGRFEVTPNELGGFHFLTPVTINEDNNFVVLKVKASSLNKMVELGTVNYNAVSILFNNGDEVKSNSNNTCVKGDFAYICANVGSYEKVSARISADDIDIVGLYLV